jgi:seryl-tRNA synthetase
MHDIKWIRDNEDSFDSSLKKRGLKPHAKILIELDDEKRQLITLIQKLQQSRNEKAEMIAKLSKSNSSELKILKRDAIHIKDKLSELEHKLAEDIKLENILSSLPNIPADDVVIGKGEDDNLEIRKWGNIPKFSFKPKEHNELGEALGLMDFEQTAKISGSRFVTLHAGLAKLERALANFMLDHHTVKFNYQEVSPPLLVRENAMYGTGQFPNLATDSFETKNGYHLIPTSEVSLTNLVAGKILDQDKLPLRYVAYTPCFRSEAGSAGKDTKGMIRLHQFSKVELVSITAKEDSHAEHDRMTHAAEEILKLLGLPYRVMLLCTGDMGFNAEKTYDLEVWLPGQNKYREISSCSNCGSFQARRLKARYNTDSSKKQKEFVHTLNGSALAVGRTLVAILENYQQEDGSIKVPDVLLPYMSGIDILR